MTTQVLVLDDEVFILRLCERLLTQAGYEVRVSSEPQQVLNLLHYVKWDLLIVDIRMPGMSGFEVIRQAKNIQPDLAVLVMTGFGTVETAIQALRQGVDGLLLKPFEAKEFLDAVEQALRDNQNKQEALKSRMLRPLFDVTELLLAETRPGALDDLVVSAAMTHFRSEHVAFYEHKGDNLILLASRGAAPRDEQDPLLSYALAHNAPLLLLASEQMNASLRQAFVERGLGSALFVFAQRPDTEFLLFAARQADELPFYESDLDMFSILARQAAIAMENARLYDALRAYIAQLEASQQALLQAEKMAAAGRLSASIAHEINNPLQSVQNCLHLSMQEELPAERRQAYFDLALNELNRLRDTVRRMLDFYRQAPIDLDTVDVHAILENTRRLLEPQFIKGNIRLDWLLKAKETTLPAVENQLQQVFVNLLLNAYDAVAAGGQVTLETYDDETFVYVAVADNGPGVPSEIRSRIFEPFMSTKDSGTGLGLTVSYNIIAAHHGLLWLDENWSPGARFVVRLPKKIDSGLSSEINLAKENADGKTENPSGG